VNGLIAFEKLEPPAENRMAAQPPLYLVLDFAMH
jgi:hypothetical protein